MKNIIQKVSARMFVMCFGERKNAGMELIQVAILIAIAIVIGLIFRSRIQEFIENVFSNLSAGKFL